MSNGSVEFSFDAPVRDLSRALNDFQRRQIPFATVLAIKFTLEDAQKKLRGELSSEFTIRNTFLEKGIRTKFANKRNLAGRVFTVDEILRRQITGGRNGTASRPVSLPRGIRGRGLANERKPAAKIFRKRRRPGALRSKKRHFEQPLPSGDVGQFKRIGKKAYPIELQWRIRSKPIQIDSRFDFEAIAKRVFARRWDKNFGKALGRALATSR